MNNELSYPMELIDKCLRGEATQEEQSLLLQWRASHSDHEQYFQEVQKVWQLSGRATTTFEPNVNAAWDKLQARIDSSPGAKEVKASATKAKVIVLKPWMRVAASIALFLGIALWLLSVLHQPQMIEVATTNATRMIFLPDSSKVWLNKHSSIKYAQNFNDNNRVVSLDGEAFFEVRKANGMSFVVKGHSTTTEVLGTSFNIKAYKDAEEEAIEVVTGKVAFSSQTETSDQVILLPGNTATLEKGKNIQKSQQAHPSNGTAWRTGVLNFDNARLADVVQELSMYFQLTIELDNEQLNECRFTGSFERPSLEEVLKVITLTTNTSSQNINGTHVLSGKGCETYTP